LTLKVFSTTEALIINYNKLIKNVMRKNTNFYLRTAAMLSMAVVMCCSAALLSSCKEDDENIDEPKVTPSLAVSATTLPVAAIGGDVTFTVTTNVAWTASTTADFVTLSPTSGATTTVVTATVSENTGEESRTATITVSGEGVDAKTVTVAQGGASAPPPPTFEVSPETITVPSTWGIYPVTVTTEDDITWTAIGAPASVAFPLVWDVLEDYSDAPGPGFYTHTGSGTFRVYAAANPGTTLRSGTVTVTSEDGLFSKVITFTQNPVMRASISPLELRDAPKAGATAPVLVLSSIPWTATASGTGVSVSPTSGNGGANESFTVTIANNSGSTERTGSITVTAGDFTFTIPVSQRGTADPTMEYVQYNGLKWAKYNQGFKGAIPSKITYGGVFPASQINDNLCPAGWRLPALSDWITINTPLRSAENSVNGFYMNGNGNNPTLSTHPFIPFINYAPGESTYQDTGAGNDGGVVLVQTLYATSNAITDVQNAVRINPWDEGGAVKFWIGPGYSDAVSIGETYGFHVRCVQD
jgi:hypothetical protein